MLFCCPELEPTNCQLELHRYGKQAATIAATTAKYKPGQDPHTDASDQSPRPNAPQQKEKRAPAHENIAASQQRETKPAHQASTTLQKEGKNTTENPTQRSLKSSNSSSNRAAEETDTRKHRNQSTKRNQASPPSKHHSTKGGEEHNSKPHSTKP